MKLGTLAPHRSIIGGLAFPHRTAVWRHRFNESIAFVIWKIVSLTTIIEKLKNAVCVNKRTMRCSGRRVLLWFGLVLLLGLVGRLLVSRGFRQPIPLIGNDDILTPKSHLSSRQRAQTVAPAFVAGMYMAGLQPRNSSCRWYHGLPDVISYPASKVTWSPEIGEKSPYRVLPFVLVGTEERNKLPQVTLCTHATADHVYGIVELVRRWEGPLSLAIFTPGLDAGTAVALLDRACRCEPEMYKVSPCTRCQNGSLEA